MFSALVVNVLLETSTTIFCTQLINNANRLYLMIELSILFQVNKDTERYYTFAPIDIMSSKWLRANTAQSSDDTYTTRAMEPIIDDEYPIDKSCTKTRMTCSLQYTGFLRGRQKITKRIDFNTSLTWNIH